MSSYSVRVKAILDASGIKGQLQNIGKTAKLNIDSSGVKKAQKDMTALGNTSRQVYSKTSNAGASMGKQWNGILPSLKQGARGFVEISKKVALFGASTAIIRGAGQGIGAMAKSVTTLDSSLTELKKVTDLEGESLKKFTDQAFEAGKGVAKTGTEMVDASTEFAKAGYKDQALDLAKVATMYQNIADEEVSAADAATLIISQLKAFKSEGIDAMKVIDQINEVSNNFAVSSSDLATAIPKVAATMAQAGNSSAEALGLLTAGTEMMPHQASRVARGLRSITLNLQGMTAEGKTSTKFQAKMQKEFDRLGISLKDSGGQMKSTYQILGELSNQWGDLDANTKNYFAALIGGKTQVDVVNGVLSNFDTAIGATGAAMNSAGSAAAENAKVLDSVEGHINRLKSAFELFAYKTLESDTIKAVLDLGTALLTGLASPAGQAVGKAMLLATGIGLLSRAFLKLSAASKGLTALQALKKLWLGDAAATTADTAAINQNTAAKMRNATASNMQGMSIKRGGKLRKADTLLTGLDGKALKSSKGMNFVGGLPKKFNAVEKSAGKAGKSVGTFSKVGSKLKSGWSKVTGLITAHPFLALATGIGVAGYALAKTFIPSLSDQQKKAKQTAKGIKELEAEYDALRSKSRLTGGEKARLDYLDEEIEKRKELLKVQKENNAETQLEARRGSKGNKNAPAGYTEIGEKKSDVDTALDKFNRSMTNSVRTYNKAMRETDTTKRQSLLENSQRITEEAQKEAKVIESLRKEYNDAYKVNPDAFTKADKEARNSLNNWHKQNKQVLAGNITDLQKYRTMANEILKSDDSQIINSGAQEIFDLDNMSAGEKSVESLKAKTQDYVNTLKSGNKGTESFNKMLNELNATTGDVKLNKQDQFIADPAKLEDEAAALNLTAEAYSQVLEHQAKQGNVEFKFSKDSIEAAGSAITKLDKTLVDSKGKVTTSAKSFDDWAKTQNYTKSQANSLQKSLEKQGHTFVDFSASGKNMQKQLQGLGKDFGVVKNAAGSVEKVNLGSFVKSAKDLGASNKDIKGMVSSFNKMDGIKFSGTAKEMSKYGASVDKADSKTKKLVKSANKAANKKTKLKIDADTKGAEKGISKVDKSANKVSKKKHKVKIGVEEQKGGKGGIAGIAGDIAKATKKSAKAKVDIEVKNQKDLDKAKSALEKMPPNTQLNISVGGMEQIQTAEQAAESLGRLSGQTIASTLTISGIGQVEKGTTTVNKLKKAGPVKYTNTISTSTPGASSAMSTISWLKNNSTFNRTNTITTVYKTKGEKPGKKAKGKSKGEQAGWAWTGEEGPELVQTKDSAYITGSNGWEMQYLNKDDVVYTAQETKSILAGNRDIGIPTEELPRYAKGRKYLNPDAKIKKGKKKGDQTKQAKKDERKANAYDRWLDTQQYLLDMDQISEATFMKRLKKRIAKNKSTTKEQYRDAKRQLHDYQKAAVQAKMDEYTKRAEYNAKGFSDGKAYLDKAKKARKISSKEYKEMLNELYNSKLTFEFKQFESDKRSYASLKKLLQDYVKAGKITYSEYYAYLDDLADAAKDKELKRLEELQEKEDAKKQLLEMYVDNNITNIDKQIEALEKENEVQQAGNDLAEKEAALAKAKNQRVRVYREGVGFVYERDMSAIKEAQQALKDAEVEKQISDLEKLKDQWQELQDYIDNWERAQEQLNLEQQAGMTMDQLTGNMGADLETFRALYSLIGSKVEGYADVIALLENAETKDAINALLGTDGQIKSSLIDSWIKQNFHDWELSSPPTSPNPGEDIIKILQGFKLEELDTIRDWANIAKTQTEIIRASSKSSAASASVIQIQDLNITGVQNVNDFISEISKLPTTIVQKK